MVKPEDVLTIEEWYSPSITKAEMKQFLRRDNWHGLVNFAIWFALLAGVGYLGYLLINTLWAIPVFFLYGVIYAGSNGRHHECMHGTVFKTRWLNDFFYFFCGVMEIRDIIDFRWSHTRHHSYTIWRGVDPEILVMRPPKLSHFLLDFFYLRSGPRALFNMVLHSFGIVSAHSKNYVEPEDYKRMFWWSRANLVIWLGFIGLAVYFHSWLPLLYFGLPRFYGGFFLWCFVLLQHVGLSENVWDHRKNTSSVHVNPFLSFLFMHMENHVEHHLFPLVPYHQLPKLHQKLKEQVPVPYKSLWHGMSHVVPMVIRQRRDPNAFIDRSIPFEAD